MIVSQSQKFVQYAFACAVVLFGTEAGHAQNPDKQSFEVIEHGRYMATAADCTASRSSAGRLITVAHT